MIRPPITAPLISPMPPKTVAAKVLVPVVTPMEVLTLRYVMQVKIPATAANADPKKKVMDTMLSTEMPISCVAVRFSAVARMAIPVGVFFTNHVNTSISTTEVMMVTICTIVIFTPKSLINRSSIMVGYSRDSEPRKTKNIFSRK